jgi:predicted nucleic acid-binding protein
MNRFVLDTDVIIAALRSPKGASAALVGAALDHQIVMQASVPLFFLI